MHVANPIKHRCNTSTQRLGQKSAEYTSLVIRQVKNILARPIAQPCHNYSAADANSANKHRKYNFNNLVSWNCPFSNRIIRKQHLPISKTHSSFDFKSGNKWKNDSGTGSVSLQYTDSETCATPLIQTCVFFFKSLTCSSVSGRSNEVSVNSCYCMYLQPHDHKSVVIGSHKPHKGTSTHLRRWNAAKCQSNQIWRDLLRVRP